MEKIKQMSSETGDGIAKKVRALGAAAIFGLAAGGETLSAADENKEKAPGNENQLVQVDENPRQQNAAEEESLYSEADYEAKSVTPSFVQEQINRILNHPLTEIQIEDEIAVDSVAVDVTSGIATAFVRVGAETILVDLSRAVEKVDEDLTARPSGVGGLLIIELEKQGAVSFSRS